MGADSAVLVQAGDGVDMAPRLKTLKVCKPPVRSLGIVVALSKRKPDSPRTFVS